MSAGSVNARVFMLSSAWKSGRKGVSMGRSSAGFAQTWQKKDPLGASRRGGSQHKKWKTRGQVSQHTNSPAPLQAEQRSSLSDGGESWQGVRGGDKVELGGEYGYLRGVMPAARIMSDVVGDCC